MVMLENIYFRRTLVMKIAMISFLVFFNKDSGVMTQKLIGRMSSSQSSSCSNVLVGIDQMQADTEWGPISISIEIRSIAALFYFSSCARWACVPVCCVPPLNISYFSFIPPTQKYPLLLHLAPQLCCFVTMFGSLIYILMSQNVLYWLLSVGQREI